MGKIERTPAIERAAVKVCETVSLPQRVDQNYPGGRDAWLAERAGWVRTTTMPKVGTSVLVDAHGSYRVGVVVDTAQTRATVAVTTPSAIQTAAKHGCGLSLVIRPFPLASMRVRKS